jgi:hypothetical protein
MTQTPKELTETPDLVRGAIPLDLVSDVLSTVRLSGAIFLRAEYTEPWAYESPSRTISSRYFGHRRIGSSCSISSRRAVAGSEQAAVRLCTLMRARWLSCRMARCT